MLTAMHGGTDRGADVNGNISIGATPFGLAARGGLTGIIKCLLKAGADANMPNKIKCQDKKTFSDWNECRRKAVGETEYLSAMIFYTMVIPELITTFDT
ncbi:uncharacterized protein LOC120105337 [Phoenix dactylifera]|uniref:Uncharacterized protein LOC120105337 n=1 Tax=Phoenix dactylifera TaxID=42345 RepID=A0A8B8ZHJ5_PHODC|nr:uncharacterized protein LOC120105337 [Phoenix dactylifera]